jgi:beta-galactosidase/beta-glucuronidase
MTVFCISGRDRVDFCADWKFTVTPTDTITVTLPHTWNALDAQDGGKNYLRTEAWYHKSLQWDKNFQGKRIFLEFLGANMQAECFVNGSSVGVHKGGYTAFRFDITDRLVKGENKIAVKVDNRFSEEIAPLSADFSFFGGLYRKVFLIVAEPVHVDLTDCGASGLYLTTTNVSAQSAELEIRAKVVNTSSRSQKLTLQADLQSTPDKHALKTLAETITIPANGVYEFKKKITVENPHLWNGKEDPYRYAVDFTIKEKSKIIDKVSDYVGFRYFSATKEGFFLNGNPYPLRGVNRHQDRKDMGNAITEREHYEDFELIYRMGANAIRLAHYPHAPYFYELCDQYGIIVWAEIPFVNNVGTAPTFAEVTKNQLRELIRQQYNRPSICFWSLQNEVAEKYDSIMQPLTKELNDVAHAEDPTRYTVQAVNHSKAEKWASDLIARNAYPGWYRTSNERLKDVMDKPTPFDRPLAISEYGAGGSIYQHETIPVRPKHNGDWHPEEYQSKVHEDAMIDITASPNIWGTFVWNMFDFAADNRAEGDHHGINDKGLVTHDRKTLKDSYYIYKVNWNSNPELYIASRRHNIRKENTTPVTIYSNCRTVELFVNGISQGKKQKDAVQCGIFRWDNIELQTGNNIISTIAITPDGKTLQDEVKWAVDKE